MTLRTGLSPADAYAKIKTQAGASKTYLLEARTTMQQANVPSHVPLRVIKHLGQAVGLLNTWAATPGLAAYARAQEDDPTYDVVAEFQAMRDAMQSTLAQLIALFPKDVNGWLLYETLEADGRVTHRTFTAAQLATVIPLIDAVLATIT